MQLKFLLTANRNSIKEKATSLIFFTADHHFVPKHAFYQPQYVQYKHHGIIFVLLCVAVLFADNTRYQCNSVKWLPTGFVMFFSCIFRSVLESSVLHCYLFEMLRSK